MATRPSRLSLAAAFGAINLIWGSNFLAIRYAVQTIPPFALMGVRSVTAGAMLLGWGLARGAPVPTAREWRDAAIGGSLLFLLGHGSLAWGQQYVASGVAALLLATVPAWMVILEWRWLHARAPTALTWIGLALGIAGIAVLVGPAGFDRAPSTPLVPAIVLVMGAMAWAMGSVAARRLKLPRSIAVASGMQLTTGGLMLCGVSLLAGDFSHRIEPSVRSMLAATYMVLFASIVGLTVYTWLLRVSSPGRVGSYAFVNPLVAVFVGWAIGGETISLRTIVAAAIVITSVVVIMSARRSA